MPQSLFGDDSASDAVARAPLADRMRPQTLDQIVGQDALVGPSAAFRRLVESDQVPSCVFWGPPGTGKTTLAEVIAKTAKADFVRLSAVTSGVADIRKIVARAEQLKKTGRRTILFIDEIHRFNKGQQDALLPHVERGTLVFIGATTENPSFEVNGALLSRARVFVLEPLSETAIKAILERALSDETNGLGGSDIQVDRNAMDAMVGFADGDARTALNILEMVANLAEASADAKGKKSIGLELVKKIIQRSQVRYDKNGEEHYNVISALHKSLRGSDADASLYWLARMLEAGEDPVYVARRLVRFAAEDVGLADPQAVVLAVAVMQAVQLIGMPECNVHLAELAAYLAKAPKSNAVYLAYGRAASDARETSDLGVPLHLRNAPTRLMKDLGYGKDYKYNPSYDGPVDQEYLPPELKGKKYL